MRFLPRSLVFSVGLLTAFVAQAEPLTLIYPQPAVRWTEALPLGNGRLGAMVFGGVSEERLQLNEATLWSGGPRDWNNPEAKEALAEVRAAVQKGDYEGATELAKKMQGPYTQSYQPLGDLRLSFNHAGKADLYHRELDLSQAAVTITYRVGEVDFRREVWASHPDQVVVVRLTASKPGQLEFSVSANSPLHYSVATDGADQLVMRGKAPSHVDPNYFRRPRPVRYEEGPNAEGTRFALRVKVLPEGGAVEEYGSSLRIRKADAVTLLVSAATSFHGFDRSPGRDGRDEESLARSYLDGAIRHDLSALRQRHESDHRALFDRVSLDLGQEAAAVGLSTEERLVRFFEGGRDPGLATLLYQYGRYLMIASSRPGGQAANLQGIWNEAIQPPWSSNYTLNINAQMNYWPAEVAALPECHEPLFGLIEALASQGAKTASVNYGARGWVAHHNADIWGHSAPVGNFGDGNPMWANWSMGGAWLATHLWEHFLFGGDEAYLRTRSWPLMKGAAEFCLDWLILDEQGYWTTSPSTSPEIDFITPRGGKASVTRGATMDLAIIDELFRQCLAAAQVLGIDDEFTRRVAAVQPKLLPPRIGARGQLQEWSDDFLETDVNHRHTSHLFGVYPGTSITPEKPELFAAARRSLDLRGDEGTGWALGWRINLWARFRDGERSYVFVRNLLRPVGGNIATNYKGGGGVYPNLFDAHPPFQIDGNFAFTSGVSEMLVQSHAGVIDLLPALPPEWAKGSVRGLRARGGVVIQDLSWEKGQLQSVTVRSTRGGMVRLRYGKSQFERTLAEGETFTVDGELKPRP